jgi:hypothetical protein
MYSRKLKKYINTQKGLDPEQIYIYIYIKKKHKAYDVHY